MKQIIAMGGGGFSMEPDNPLLDDYILAQSRRERPRVCFVPTASGDSDGYVERFYEHFRSKACVPSHLSLFSPEFTDLEDYVLEQDVIYVGGGSTKNLLALWREWGLDSALSKALSSGTVLAGLSAGSLCWFESGVTDSFGEVLVPIRCLGLLGGSHSPHYNEPKYRAAYRDFIQNGALAAGIAAEDSVALHYIDGNLTRVVSSRREACAFYVSAIDGVIEEQPIVPEFLGF